jgi:hypothetical protein
LLCLAHTTVAQTLYVDANATTKPHDGSSWCNAFLTLNDALPNAPINTTIRVADGTYTPTSDGNRAASFILKERVTVEGGYAGCGAPNPDERDIALNETILSGDLLGDDGPGFTNRSDNSEHVVSCLVLTYLASLDGFTISGGYTANASGGGIVIHGSSPSVRRCTIRDNHAGYSGGGMIVALQSPYAAAPTIADCAFLDNRTIGYEGGGGLRSWQAQPIIRNCTFARNTAPNASGGAMHLYRGKPTIDRCTMLNNSASYYGAVNIFYSDALFIASRFLGNSTTGSGGAVGTSNGNFAFVNCDFVGNVSRSAGGAVSIQAQTPAFTNCTFVANESLLFEGGGLYINNSDARLTNCIFWNNRGSQGVVPSAQIFAYVSNFNPRQPTVNYSDVQGSWSGLGVSNIDLFPRFVREPDDGGDGWGVGDNDDFGDLRLAAGSPCIDVGDKSVDTDLNTTGVQPLPATDLAGHPRLADDPVAPDGGPPPAVDMGAYEYQADCNANTIIDSVDLDTESSLDCNDDGVPDECESQDDCNETDTQDICDLAEGSASDCNRNHTPDACDIAGGTSLDSSANGIPDECERSLAGYWQFDLQLETGCFFLDRYANERRYLRFDESGALVESWMERNGQYLKVNYPSTDGPSYNRFALDGLHTSNVDRNIGSILFTPYGGALRLTEYLDFTDEDYMDTCKPYAGTESGLTFVEGGMNSAGDAMTGTWLFRDQWDSLCGTFTASKLAGAPPDLPVIIDLVAASVAASTDGPISRPGSVPVDPRVYRVKSSFLSSDVELRYLLSADLTPDVDDPMLGSELIQPGPGGMLGLQSGEGPMLTIPECVPPGKEYHLLLVVDASNAISEYDENNNVVAVSVTLNPPPALTDLNGNCATDLPDAAMFVDCIAGPASPAPLECQPQRFARADLDNDGDADLADFATLVNAFVP